MLVNWHIYPSAGEVRVPPYVANLGGEFEELAIAVWLYLRLRIVEVWENQGARLTVIKNNAPVRSRNAVEHEGQEPLAFRATGVCQPSEAVPETWASADRRAL